MRVNLLPREVTERQAGRRRTTLAVLLGIVALALLGVFYLFQQMRLNEVRKDLEAQETVNARLNAQIAELQQFDDLQRELTGTRELLQAVLVDEVRWSGVLRDLSLVIPGRIWFETLTGAVTTAESTVEGEPTGLVGQLNFTGFALSHRDTALLLSRLEEVEGFVNPWASLSELTPRGTTRIPQFTASADLSELALASAKGGQR